MPNLYSWLADGGVTSIHSVVLKYKAYIPNQMIVEICFHTTVLSGMRASIAFLGPFRTYDMSLMEGEKY